MPHDTIFVAILGMLFYIFVPQYFGYVAVVLALWLGVPVMRVVWQTTKDLRDIPAAEAEKDENNAEDDKGDDKAEDGEDDDNAEDENDEDKAKAGMMRSLVSSIASFASEYPRRHTGRQSLLIA